MGEKGSDPLLPRETKVRKFPRMRADFTLAYHRAAGDGSYGPPQLARTHTLGLGGLMFESEQALVVGEMLRVELVIADQAIAASARVVYADRAPGGLFQNGLEFVELSEEDREALLACYLQHEYRIPSEE